MAEFEELRLTVNLVDNASPGLMKIRAEIGQLTGSAKNLTQAVNVASTSVTNLANTTNKTSPVVRTLNQHMREGARAGEQLRNSFQSLGVATRGLSSMPQIAAGVRDMGLAVWDLGTAFGAVNVAARVAAIGVGSVALGVAALGAVVVAYGVSVFHFAREMDVLGKTAKQMGMSFAELKFAQDEAKRFGMSSESIVRSFQGIQDAQFDLWKNNSQLRQRLIGMGVDANWVNQLATMDPNKARNAVVRYAKALERQLLQSGVAKGIARSLANQFAGEFGVSAEDVEIGELADPSPERAKELDRIAILSKEIALLWGDIGHEWNIFETELLAIGLPILRDALISMNTNLPALLAEMKTGLIDLINKLPGFIETIPETLTSIRTNMTAVAEIFKDVYGLYQKVFGQSENIKKDAEKKDAGATGIPQDDAAKESADRAAKAAPLSGSPAQAEPPQGSIGEAQDLPSPAGPSTVPGAARPPVQLQNYRGANDNNPLVQQINFTTAELADETDKNVTEVGKLTAQLEKLNLFFERMEDAREGQGKGGVQTAAYHPGGGGGKPGGGGTPLDRAFATAKETGQTEFDLTGNTPPGGGARPPGGGASPQSQAPAAPAQGSAPAGTAQNPSQAPGGLTVNDAQGNPTRAQGIDLATDKVIPEATKPETASSSAPAPGGAMGPSNVKVDNSIAGRIAGIAALRADTEAAGMTTTSGYRDPGHRLSKAFSGSKHIQGLAFDTRAQTPEQVDAAMAKQREMFAKRGMVEGRDYTFKDEVRNPSGHATGKHLHTQLTPEGMQRYQQSKVAEKSNVPGVAVAGATTRRGDNPLQSLYKGGELGGNITLPEARDLPSPSELNRATLTASQDQSIRADGTVAVTVADKNAAQSAGQNKEELFRATKMREQNAGQLTEYGPTVEETAHENKPRRSAGMLW